MRSQVEEKFSDFYEKWMIQLESDLHLLLVSVSKDGSNGPDHESLVARVTAHQKVYYTAKWAAAHDEVLAFFRPVWLSPLEKAYLWVTGWKPSAVFRLVESARGSSLAGMSEGQVKKVEELRVRIRLEEEKVEREMERVQVSVADRRMVELARVAGRAQVQARDGDAARVDGMVDDSVNTLLAGYIHSI